MQKISAFCLCTFMFATLSAQNRRSFVRADVPLDSIVLSDPFIFADEESHTYFMTGTGGFVWKSPDLKKWTGPLWVVETDTNSWMGKRPMIWAAEIHKHNAIFVKGFFANRFFTCGYFPLLPGNFRSMWQLSLTITSVMSNFTFNYSSKGTNLHSKIQ